MERYGEIWRGREAGRKIDVSGRENSREKGGEGLKERCRGRRVREEGRDGGRNRGQKRKGKRRKLEIERRGKRKEARKGEREGSEWGEWVNPMPGLYVHVSKTEMVLSDNHHLIRSQYEKRPKLDSLR